MDSEVRPDYSGRGMFGATCVGWDDNNKQGSRPFEVALAQVIGPDLLHYDEDEELDLEDLDEVLDQLGSPSSDGMGLGTVYYYRNVQVEGHERKSSY